MGLVLPPPPPPPHSRGFLCIYSVYCLFVWVVKVYGVEIIYTWSGCGDEIHYVRELITRAIYC